MKKYMQSIAYRRLLLLAACMVMSASIGCGKRDGPQRFSRQGAITFNGQSVGKGEIIFSPDRSKGASGPGATVTFEDGTYRTRKGKGTLSGPHLVEISGYDGNSAAKDPNREPHPWGNTLFENYRVEIEFPAENSTHDFNVTE
ncbi:hypothetical protein [Aeoliella sp.]|uniref:hypothetical protein n=1 Tax=Aeoliella sp. TaxID=2795800 RepID=UPI003CCC4581